MENNNPKTLKKAIEIIDEMHKDIQLGFAEIGRLRDENKRLKEFRKKIYELAEIEERSDSLPFE